MHIQPLIPQRLALGECPNWDAATGQLWAMDCRRGYLLRIDPASGQTEQHLLPAPTGSFALNADGRIVIAMKEALGLYDPASRQLHTLAELDQHLPHLRLNDGCALPDGRFLVGSMHLHLEEGETPKGGIYVLERDGQLARMGPALKTANGPLIHPHNGRLFIADSAAQSIYSFDISSGQAQDQQLFISTQPQQSAPDGCCWDSDGGLWTAMVRTGQLARYDAQGALSELISLPVAHPSALCFGGPNLADLYVTSISDSGRLRAGGPLDGAILRITGLGYRGLAKPQARILIHD